MFAEPRFLREEIVGGHFVDRSGMLRHRDPGFARRVARRDRQPRCEQSAAANP